MKRHTGQNLMVVLAVGVAVVSFAAAFTPTLLPLRQYHRQRNTLLYATESLPDIKLVICQPFVLTETSAVDETWLEPFSAYQEVAAKISREFDATWVPFQSAFDKALEQAPAKYWAQDGVHPSMAGAQLMAETWLHSL